MWTIRAAGKYAHSHALRASVFGEYFWLCFDIFFYFLSMPRICLMPLTCSFLVIIFPVDGGTCLRLSRTHHRKSLFRLQLTKTFLASFIHRLAWQNFLFAQAGDFFSFWHPRGIWKILRNFQKTWNESRRRFPISFSNKASLVELLTTNLINKRNLWKAQPITMAYNLENRLSMGKSHWNIIFWY